MIFEQAHFNRRNQQEGETAEKYIMELYTLADNCKYGDLRDEMIRDRLVVGIRDAALSQQLQLDAELTLEKAKTKVRQREAVREQQRVLSSNTPSAGLGEVHSHKRFTPNNGGQRRHARGHGDRNGQARARDMPPSKQCTQCRRSPHPREQCPARDATCHRCNKKGHYGAQCLTKRKQVSSTQTTAWLTTLNLKGHSTQFKLDT